jgi:Uma2 family endonuclease
MRPTARNTLALPGTTVDPVYPDYMRKRYMGETDYHSIAMFGLREMLEDHFAADLSVYVATSIVLYFEKGNPRRRRDPDVLVAKGTAGKHKRRAFRVWEEGVLPCTVFELASKHTWREDLGPKRREYARQHIPEYFLFDPEGRYISPVLRGFRSVNGRAVEIEPTEDGHLISEQLGLRLEPHGSLLRLYDLRTGRVVPTRREKADAGALQADAAIRQADAAIRQADSERRRADQLAAELARLRAQLRRGRRRTDDNA